MKELMALDSILTKNASQMIGAKNVAAENSAKPSKPPMPEILSPKRGIQSGTRNVFDNAIDNPAIIIITLTCQTSALNFWIMNRAEVLLLPLNAKLNNAFTSSSNPNPGLRAISNMEANGL